MSPESCAHALPGPLGLDPPDTLVWGKPCGLARLLRNRWAEPHPYSGPEQEFAVTIPQLRIFEAVSDLIRAAGGVLGRGVARVVGQRGESPVTKQVVLPGPPATVPPGRRVYAIGDIHGRADLLVKLLDELRADIEKGGFEGRPILVFLGDYVDRGFQSKDVIDVLLGSSLSPFETYFLKGNHEAAMLQFLRDPSIGPRWAEFGGVETLVSYGVRPPRTRTSPDEWALASQTLNDMLPPNHLHFLTNLDLSVRIGDYVFVHAGVRPGVPLDQQSEYDLLWIRDEFLSDRRPLGAVIVHGHTPTSKPHKDSRRIGVDTGAYLSGRLTAARFEHDGVEFISTGPRIEAAPVGSGS
jgi:serine/threonine protein phosphatase 1